jgi:serine protease inhibitor
MILDRPFLFMILGADQVPLFIGIVDNPQGS